MFTLRCATAQYHQTICAVKTDSRALHLQRSKTLEKHENKEKLFENNVYALFCSYFYKTLYLF